SSSVSLIANGTASGTGAGTTATVSSLACTGANAYLIGIASGAASITAVTDGSSHSYTQVPTAYAGGAGDAVTLYYFLGVSGATETFSVTANYPSIYVACFSNVSAFDSGATGNDTGSTNAALPSLAPTQASGALMVSAITWDSTSGSVSINSGFTITDQHVL